MNYGLLAEEQQALQEGLRAIPDTPAPRIIWERVREQAEAEGLIKRPVTSRNYLWTVIGLAASMLLAVLIVPRMLAEPETTFPVLPTNEAPTNIVAVNGLQALMVESRQLETDLRSLPSNPRVVRASTAATITELEDRIAAIDFQLNDSNRRMQPEDEEIFWRERVRLMKTLLRLRYAQAQRAVY